MSRPLGCLTLFLLPLLLGLYVSAKPAPPDPEEGLLCFTNHSLTRSDTDGEKHTLPVQPWQRDLGHTPCLSYPTCNAPVGGVHVPTTEGTAYVLPGRGTVFVVMEKSRVTSLALTVNLHAKDCNLNKMIAFANGFIAECKREKSSNSLRLIPVLFSSGKWSEKDPVVINTGNDKSVNSGVSAVLKLEGLHWYFFAQEDRLCSHNLLKVQTHCSPLDQDKCPHVAEILSVPEKRSLLIACSTAAGSRRRSYIALYRTSSARVEKYNFPTGEFRAIHLSSSGNFTSFVGATFIIVVRTLDNSSSAQQREIPTSGEVVFSLVSDEVLLFTTAELAPTGAVTYSTFTLDLAKAFNEGATAELLQGDDNCTVTESPAPGEWIVACSNALFWYRSMSSAPVRISWLDGSAKEQQCFTGSAHALLDPATDPPAPSTATVPDSECEYWKTAFVVTIATLAVAVVVIVALVVIIVVLCVKVRRNVKSREPPRAMEPSAQTAPEEGTLANPEQVELPRPHLCPSPNLLRHSLSSHSLQSTPSPIPIPRCHSTPALNDMVRESLTSLYGIHSTTSTHPQSSHPTSRPTHTGTLQSPSASSMGSRSSTATNTPHASTCTLSSSGSEQPSLPQDTTEAGEIIASPKGRNGGSESTVWLSTQSRAVYKIGSGARYPWHS